MQKKKARISWAVRPKICFCPSGKTNGSNSSWWTSVQHETMSQKVECVAFHVLVIFRRLTSVNLRLALRTQDHQCTLKYAAQITNAPKYAAQITNAPSNAPSKMHPNAPSKMHPQITNAPSKMHPQITNAPSNHQCTLKNAPSKMHPQKCTLKNAPSKMHPQKCTLKNAPSK